MTHPSSAEPVATHQELGQLLRSVRAHLEWHAATGSLGLPRETCAAPISLMDAPVPSPARTAPWKTDVAASPPSSSPLVAAPAAAASAVIPSLPVAAPACGERLALLGHEVSQCTRCPLASTRTQTVFARGNPAALLCFVGEAPGADEDLQGVPFVGRAGQLLDKMIRAMGLDPARDVYVCNVIKCRPPGNRKPTPEETRACFPYLQEQLAQVSPKVIVTLGNTATSALLGTTEGITRLRGVWKLYQGTTLVMPTYHPSYLLRPFAEQAGAKRDTWKDLQAVMEELRLPPAP